MGSLVRNLLQTICRNLPKTRIQTYEIIIILILVVKIVKLKLLSHSAVFLM